MVLKGRGRGRDRKIMKMKKVVTFSSPPIPKNKDKLISIVIQEEGNGRSLENVGGLLKPSF